MNLESQNTYSDRCKFYLPSYNLPPVSRPMDSTDGVVVLPLFQAWAQLDPEYHINSAFWVYHSFLENSDIIDRRVPMVFYLDKKCWESRDVRTMFKAAHIPEASIWLFDVPDRSIGSYYLGLKMCPLWDERFDKFETVLIWDTDLFVSRYGDTEKVEMRDLFHRELPTQPAALHIQRHIRKPFRLDKTHNLHGVEAKRRQDEIMMELCGTIYEEGVYAIGGCVHSFCPNQIKASYKDFYRKALPLIGDDEMILSLWSIHENEEVQCLDSAFPRMAYEPSHMHEFVNNEQPFLAHLWVESIDNPKDIDLWKACIGFRKRKWVYPHLDEVGEEVSRTHIDTLEYSPSESTAIAPIVAYLNLERRQDRKEGFESNMRAKGYEGEIHRIIATDMEAFDGYKDFIRFAMKRYPSFEKMWYWNAYWIAYQFSYMNALHWVLSQDRQVLLFEDDMTIRYDWQSTLNVLNHLPSDFKIAILNYNHCPAMQRNLPYYGNGWEIGAKTNGTSCNLYTPQSAQILYDHLVSDPSESVECRLVMLDIDGIYTASPILVGTHDAQGHSDITVNKGVKDG